MRVRLLGTGSADRLPNPWCACPRCDGARRSGEHRARTSVLIDGHLLIDPGPDLGSGGVDLTGVRTVLITHDHPDHLDPAFLLAWSWVDGPPLVVAGPPDALERCRLWVAPDAPVTFRPLAAGDTLAVGDLHVRALPAAHSVLAGREHDGTALLYEVAGDARLLHASDTAALPHDQLAGPYDLVLLECTFGDRTDHESAHLDLPSFGHEVVALRAGGRLAPGAQIVAVHLSHHTPADIADRMTAVGARVVDDGDVIEVGAAAAASGEAHDAASTWEPATPRRSLAESAASPQPTRSNRRLLITGGARSGKSARAEALVAHRPEVLYVATAPPHPDDPEWVARVAAHRARRPAHWRTVELEPARSEETARGLAADGLAVLIADAPAGQTLLIDCLTLWLTGVVDAAECWDDPLLATEAAGGATDELLAALASTGADIVLVTNEVGSGLVPTTASGRLFRDLLGRLNARVAGTCDDVELVSCGLPLTLKGTPWTAST